MDSNAEQSPTTQKPARSRSPNYPALNLPEAIDRAGQFERAAGRKPVAYDVAAQYLGLSPRSGTGIRVMAALISFGILSDTGSGSNRTVSLTDLGRRLVMPSDNREEDEARREAALRPRVHAEVFERWKGKLPDDETLRRFLRLEKGFTHDAINPFIQELRDTFDCARLLSDNAEDASPMEAPERGLPSRTGLDTGLISPIPPLPGSQNLRDLSIPLASGGTAIVRAPFPLSARDLDLVIAFLHTYKRVSESHAAGEADQEPTDSDPNIG